MHRDHSKNPLSTVNLSSLNSAGITKDRVEDMEDRLRQDVLKEAVEYDDQILVADEDDSFNVFDMMLRVSEADVQTPKAMFEELQAEGYNVVYNRIPITDEKARSNPLEPKQLASACREAPIAAAELAKKPQKLTTSRAGCRRQSLPTLTICSSRFTQRASPRPSYSIVRWVAGERPRAWSSPPWCC